MLMLSLRDVRYSFYVAKREPISLHPSAATVLDHNRKPVAEDNRSGYDFFATRQGDHSVYATRVRIVDIDVVAAALSYGECCWFCHNSYC